MHIYRKIFVLSLLFCVVYSVLAQTGEDIEKKIIYRKEKCGFISLASDGFAVGYRKGISLNGFKKRMLEAELVLGKKHPKEVKSVNIYYNNSKGYVYGKLNYLFAIRGGYGIQKVLNSKPYWGGVQVKYMYYGGASLGLTRPYYLYIINPINDYEFYLTDEQFDPERHHISRIYGRGPFGKGFGKIHIYPGIYGRFAFNFEFGDYDTSIRALEAGLTIDAYYDKIPIMAYSKNKNIFISLYISFSFGKRFN